MRLDTGEIAVRRGMFPDGRITSVQAGYVVQDDERGLALWVPAGAQTIRRLTPEGEPTRYLPYVEEMRTPSVCSPSVWAPYDNLMLTVPGAGYSVWWTFQPGTGEFVGWYVNLETDSVRWFGGSDHIDQALDLLVAPERTWQYKDQDELEEQLRYPELFWDAAEAKAIRGRAVDLIARAEAGAFPFDGTWCGFRPDPAWALPVLPWWWDQNPTGPAPLYAGFADRQRKLASDAYTVVRNAR